MTRQPQGWRDWLEAEGFVYSSTGVHTLSVRGQDGLWTFELYEPESRTHLARLRLYYQGCEGDPRYLYLSRVSSAKRIARILLGELDALRSQGPVVPSPREPA